jgi:hypothetical protein
MEIAEELEILKADKGLREDEWLLTTEILAN